MLSLPHLQLQFYDAAFQRNAVVALANLVSDHKCNQSAATAAEAILHLMQLTMSSDAALQQKAVINLGYLVWNHHYCN